MRMNWLYTTAIALTIGAGAAIAQAPDQSQRREDSPHAQTPAAQSKDMDRSGAQSRDVQSRDMDRSGAADRMKERTQSEQKGGGRDMQRGESQSPGERGKQAQEPQGRDSREPTRQTQDQDRRDRPAAGTRQQSRDEQRGRDSDQATEQQRGRGDQTGRDRAQDTRQPADSRQQTQQQMDRDRRDQRDQAAQPSGTSTQQGARPTDTTQDQGARTGQAGQRAANVNDDQRRQIVDQLRRERTATRTSNVTVNIGQRLPPGIQPHRLPGDIVRIVPQYRDYDYTLVDDRVVIIDPRRREVVDILDDRPGYGGVAAYGRERIVISDDMRPRFRELVRGSSATVGATAPSGGMSASNCLSLQPVPEEMVRNNPDLGNYRYLAVGDQIVLVDPQQQKVVQVID
ncbi:DUF1236 domain-containing protein [Bradyrhizobium sp. BRP22]|uniref:DUF1236 domain-containing protein n=1 Tax=Bradyrhizobium sp. BRP22 TaxID=2793821 RepID=UPI001CD7AA29|nr:DUF1236 domain-containing protein [Bradyrhizobium sp. BRP22]MCA1455336.1 DUF1236 domain-containing protein [Bradyrhizobium sp. BRP22]